MTDPGPPFDAPLPTLRTARLVLRAFATADAGAVARNLADGRIAQNTLTIPHPYPAGAAEEFIASHAPAWSAGKRATWAVTRAADGELVGAIGLALARAHRRAEIGYWIAIAEWGKGYATEATRGVVAYAFETLGLHRVEAHHFLENPASGRVMRNAGLQPEGVHRGAVWREGRPRDLASYAILATDPRG
ncbi:MAG: GNAT family N-acetyltransferase [Gemmatimonadaceae bacterium]|nr:GNAT family N-acetyltransferase [Gemmatimonadaceae bacterium]